MNVNQDTNHDIPITGNEMSIRTKTGTFFGLLAGGLLSAFGKFRLKSAVEDLKRTEFKTSTQRLGIRFTERIRYVFRAKWLKKF